MKTPLPKLKSTLGPNRPILETTLSSFLSSWCGKFTPFQLLLSKSKVPRATLLESANTTRRDPRLVRDTISKRHIHSESLGAVIAYHRFKPARKLESRGFPGVAFSPIPLVDPLLRGGVEIVRFGRSRRRKRERKREKGKKKRERRGV